jgi:hypothetical protein
VVSNTHWSELDESWYTLYTGSDSRRKMEVALEHSEFSGYGMATDLMEGSTPWPRGREYAWYLNARTWTPSVYSLFNNTDALFSAVDFTDVDQYSQLNLTVSDLAEALSGLSVPVPNHFMAVDTRMEGYSALNDKMVNSERYVDTWFFDPDRYISGLDMVKTSGIPSSFYEQLPQSGSWKKIKRLRLDPGRPDKTDRLTREDSYLSVHMHYDWGRPDYCRQQLLALGFTAADLTP